MDDQNKTVTISQAEYDALRTPAAPAPAPAPAVTSYNTSVISGELPKTQTAKNDKIWFALGVTALLSFLIPGGFFFSVPIFLFAILAAKGIFKDTSDRPTAVKGVLLVFKVLAICTAVIFTGISALILFFVILFSSGGGHMD